MPFMTGGTSTSLVTSPAKAVLCFASFCRCRCSLLVAAALPEDPLSSSSSAEVSAASLLSPAPAALALASVRNSGAFSKGREWRVEEEKEEGSVRPCPCEAGAGGRDGEELAETDDEVGGVTEEDSADDNNCDS